MVPPPMEAQDAVRQRLRAAAQSGGIGGTMTGSTMTATMTAEYIKRLQQVGAVQQGSARGAGAVGTQW